MNSVSPQHVAANRATVMLGWREWLALPALQVAAIKAKLDSGARTSSLHVASLDVVESCGSTWLHFDVATGRKGAPLLPCRALASDRRTVTDSGGHRSLRWLIRTRVAIAGFDFETEINLNDRRDLLFPMLLGRSALQHRFVLDPALSYHWGRPLRFKRKTIADL